MRNTRACVLIAALFLTKEAGAQRLGSITFPTSAAAAAQSKFIEGVKDLHSFEFDEAAAAFHEVQRIDPGFALGYWGEAMSYNHPLWAEQNLEAARKALEKLAPTAEGRLAKAHTEKEKAFLGAVNQLFYAPGDKLARDNAYSDAMARMYDRWPEDREVDIFYALSLLGAVRPGDKGYRRQALAGAISMKVFQENPDHPGAAHFIIHAFDDPDHAILALPAARVYARIAPAAPHAIHMPSHIFLQLGMWPDVVRSNTVGYKAAVDLMNRMHLPEGGADFHALEWLEYGNLMLGQFDEARHNVDLAKQAADRNPNDQRMALAYRMMLGRYMLESGRWEKIPLETRGGGFGNRWIFLAGFSAAKLGNISDAESARAALTASGKAKSTSVIPVGVLENELAAAIELARGQKAEAVRFAKQAADIESTMPAPSGPPAILKPAFELYGELLLDAGKPAEAAAAFRQQLLKTPNRTPSVAGLARAAAESPR